ncbi:MAG: hypothetical protein M3Y87_20795, partial [Myxococcota bacterium]|nr:hypothetical protein [Myxococcota bacterium]
MATGTARSLCALVLALALMPGCGGASAAAQSTPPSAPATSAGWLVWSASEDGVTRTSWIDRGGEVVAARDGIVIAHEGSLYRAIVEREEARLPTCEQLDQALAMAPLGERAALARASMAEVGG